MPCGGIYPTTGYSSTGNECYYCFYQGHGNSVGLTTHYCLEWDAMLHTQCVLPFLQTPEGQIVIAHGHRVTIDFSQMPEGADGHNLAHDASRNT